MANYHYYNPYAYLHGRTRIDYWPASFIHQFLNPAIDFITYFLINTFSAWQAEFILGAIHGINFWLLFLLAQLFLPHKYLIPLLLAGLGMYGALAYPGIGSFQNDNLISIFILAAALLQLKALQTPSKLFCILSGFLLGIGTGLKLTAGIFMLSMLIATLSSPLPPKKRMIMTCGWLGAFALGMLCSAGYWMFCMWQQHGNPVFPFLNNIFHSADFSSANWRDVRFLPKGILQQLFFPFYFCWDGRIADVPYRDFRFPIVYLLFVCAGIKFILQKHKPVSATHYWLYTFFILSYVIWQYYFSIGRYMVALEMLTPLVTILLINYLCKDTFISAMLLTAIFSAQVLLTVQPTMIRAPWYESTFFNVQLPATISNIKTATVLTAYPAFVMDLNPRPQSYLIPFFPETWRFIGIPFLHNKYLDEIATRTAITSRLDAKQTPIFLLTSDYNMPELYRAAAIFGLTPNGDCQHIVSDRQRVSNQGVLLCPVH